MFLTCQKASWEAAIEMNGNTNGWLSVNTKKEMQVSSSRVESSDVLLVETKSHKQSSVTQKDYSSREHFIEDS